MTQSPLFAALLTPHRALSAKAIRGVIIFTCVLAFIPGLVFYAMGAWPIVGFLGLDILALYWALKTSLADKNAFEEITLWPDALDIRRVTKHGAETSVTFNPFFVRFSVSRDDEDRVTALRIVTREGAVEIGTFLTPHDKDNFAKTFGPALHRAKT